MKVYHNTIIGIHGGAGALEPSRYSHDEIQQYEKILYEVTAYGKELYSEGKSAVDIACGCVEFMENAEVFNAGRGSVFCSNEKIQMDASVMCGKTQKVGGVSLLEHVKNPILLAREVLYHSPHSLLAAEGAEEFARERGFHLCLNDELKTQKRYKQLLEAKRKHIVELDHDDKMGTVGAVCLDKAGNLAAATSTGGMTNKHYGRVSDSSIIGAGTYADNRTCAVSGTGTGDQFIQHVCAYDLHAQIFYGEKEIREASLNTLNNLQKIGGNGGLAAINQKGECILPLATKGMFRAVLSQDGSSCVSIFDRSDQ